MAGVAGVDSRLNKALQSFLIEWKGHNSASLTLKSVKGELSVTLKMKLGRYGEKPQAGRGYQNLQRMQVGPSQFRRRERRAADPVVQKKAAEYAAAAAALHPATPAEQAVGDFAEQATSAEQASPVPGQAAAGQAAVAGVPPSPPPSLCPSLPSLTSPPPSSPPLTSPPSSHFLSSPPPALTKTSPTLQKYSVKTPLPPSVNGPLPPAVTTPCPRPPPAPVKTKKAGPRAAQSLDQDPNSQVECPICYKLIQPRLMANHAKYFHVTSDLGVECPKCECNFVATEIFSHLLNSHVV